jgi:hypothetical protein
MSKPVNPHALTNGEVIAVAKLLEAVPRPFSPHEFEIVDAFLLKRDRLIEETIAKVKAARKASR